MASYWDSIPQHFFYYLFASIVIHDGIVRNRGFADAAYSPFLTRRRAFDAATASALVGAGIIAPPFPSMAQDADEARLMVPVEATSGKAYSVSIPKIGYSLYKTEAQQVPRCVELALLAGVQHFDVGSQYGTNEEVGSVLKTYISKGMEGVPNQPTKKSARRQNLFCSHKVSNAEQSEKPSAVKKAVKSQMKKLQLDYLDMCCVHSALTDTTRRLATYSALLELQNEGIVRTVGVCNYGVEPLEEILEAGFPAPSVNQLVLSPFNQHKDVVEWASNQRTILSCNAWSKLSSVQGPQEGWAILADIGKAKGMTKAQVLVRWAFQKGYLSVPRSGSKSKIERIAIQENSYSGVKDFVLSEKEMATLDGLDEKLPAGRLGIIDGWAETDILGDTWDPTLAV